MIVSTPKVDNKIQEQRTKKKDDNIEKELDNFEEKNPNVMQTQEKSGAVFDELGGNLIIIIIFLYYHILYNSYHKLYNLTFQE